MQLIIQMEEQDRAAVYQRGFSDGMAARGRVASLTPYLRVGIDDYAQGYRCGFYARKSAVGENNQTVGAVA